MSIVLALAVVLAQPPDPVLWTDLVDGWRFRPDPVNVGLAEGWQQAPYDDSEWTTIRAGERWEDQGFPDVDGFTWYRHAFEVPDAWRGKPVWLVVNGINDSAEVYCNGTLVNRFGDENVYFASVAVVADLTVCVAPGKNVLAVRVHDAGGSGGLWRLPVGITTDPNQFPIDSMIALHRGLAPDQLLVETDFVGHGSMHVPVRARVRVERPNGDVVENAAALEAASGTVSVTIPGVAAGEVLRVHVEPLDADWNVVARTAISRDFSWPAPPGWTGEYADLKPRNNFVTELYSGKLGNDAPPIEFQNPREGWIFFTVTGADAAPDLTIDKSRIVWRRNPDTGAFEAMLYREEGTHAVRVMSGEGLFEIRTVPELAFCYYPTSPNIEAFGAYDWSFMENNVLPHVNMLVSRSDIDPIELQRWRDEGRRWIYNATLPGLSGEAPTADEVFEAWQTNPGVTEEDYHGFIADEFLFNSQAHYDAWTKAIRRVHELPAFEDKKFYAWCLDLYHHVPAAEFQRTLIFLGDRFVWESYLPEDATLELAQRRFVREITQVWVAWKNVNPGIDKHMMICLGYLSAPPESLNLNPAVDYHVFMDMQFHQLATDPEFWNLYGIMEYAASYADEESLRWAHRLMRHYCIEGKTERLTDDPYGLTHIANPDFADDLSGWEVEPATQGSIARNTMEGFSWLQGRYPRTDAGDTFCVFTCSADKINQIRQQIAGLEPGRLYSVKLISAAIDALDVKQEIGMAVEVNGAELAPERCFQTVYGSNYAHILPPYSADHPAYFNFHRVVFRATAPMAELRISDWKDGKPAGPEGQRIAFNFVEVQPFRK